ncbi:hypothetical protein C8R47DRAFT_1076331 [Mycena vitilis]|nr:hypothetical protein C8R47DRAFT_1076331 [Mycena vitilis]
MLAKSVVGDLLSRHTRRRLGRAVERAVNADAARITSLLANLSEGLRGCGWFEPPESPIFFLMQKKGSAFLWGVDQGLKVLNVELRVRTGCWGGLIRNRRVRLSDVREGASGVYPNSDTVCWSHEDLVFSSAYSTHFLVYASFGIVRPSLQINDPNTRRRGLLPIIERQPQSLRQEILSYGSFEGRLHRIGHSALRRDMAGVVKRKANFHQSHQLMRPGNSARSGPKP